MNQSDDDMAPEFELFPDEEQQETVNAADPVQLRRRRTRTKLEAKKGAKFWIVSLSTASGRREIYLLLQSAGAFETPFACGPNGFPHTEATWFKAGAFDFGQRFFLALQRISPEHSLLMLEENDPRFAKRPQTKADE